MARSALSDEERTALTKWLHSDRVPMDDETRQYFGAEALARNMTFGEVLSAVLTVIADDKMIAAVLEE